MAAKGALYTAVPIADHAGRSMCCGASAPGLSSREIAEQSFISETAAANHVQNLLVEDRRGQPDKAAIYEHTRVALASSPAVWAVRRDSTTRQCVPSR
jgi:hypothetical protein